MTEMNMPAIEDEGSVVLFEEGNELFDQEKYAEAAAKFEEFVRKNPPFIKCTSISAIAIKKWVSMIKPLRSTLRF